MNWKRWLRPGIVLTFVLATAAVFVRNGAIETDLSGRVASALADEGLNWTKVEVSARDVTIRGMAPSVDAQEQAVAAAAAVSGVRTVANASDLLPVASPYIWTARRSGNALTLSGAVPSEGSRAAVLAAARRALANAEIHDSMSLARGAAPSFNSAAAFGLSRLAALADGSVTLTDSMLSVSGTAASAAAYGESRTALASPPGGVVLGPVQLLPARADPFVFSVSFDGKKVTVVGFVPNDVVHNALLATLRATLPGAPIADSAAVASGDPPGFADVASFAVAALSRLSEGGVTLDGLKLDVTGTAKSVDDYEALLSSLSRDLPPGAKVVSAAITPAVASPYFWQAEKGDAGVSLSGYVATPQDRDDVAATARTLFGGVKIDNRMRVAAGEPRMDWIGAVKFALGEVARLASGKVGISGQTFSISGEAQTADAYAALLDANSKTLPASLSLGENDIQAPRVSPYTFTAERRGAGVALSGYVPDAATRDAVLASARAKFGDDNVNDTLVFANGAPDSFSDAADAALEVVSRLAGGHVVLTDNELVARGFVYQPAAGDEISDRLSSTLPQGFSADTTGIETRQIDQPLVAGDCHDALEAVLKTGRIAFSSGQTDIAADSFGLLDRVSAVVARCADADVDVAAYSSSQGSASKNRDRTQARADAIVDFLVSAGIKRERLSGVGYGEDHPIADNNTPEGRAQNERIEFSLAVPQADAGAAATGGG